jgi:hypothetical protein
MMDTERRVSAERLSLPGMKFGFPCPDFAATCKTQAHKRRNADKTPAAKDHLLCS